MAPKPRVTKDVRYRAGIARCDSIRLALRHTDHYALLRVPPNANNAEIRKAYLKLARSEHPDKKPDDPFATANFQLIGKAYEVLKDEGSRRIYDMGFEHSTRDYKSAIDKMTREDKLAVIKRQQKANGTKSWDDVAIEVFTEMREEYEKKLKEYEEQKKERNARVQLYQEQQKKRARENDDENERIRAEKKARRQKEAEEQARINRIAETIASSAAEKVAAARAAGRARSVATVHQVQNTTIAQRGSHVVGDRNKLTGAEITFEGNKLGVRGCQSAGYTNNSNIIGTYSLAIGDHNNLFGPYTVGIGRFNLTKGTNSYTFNTIGEALEAKVIVQIPNQINNKIFYRVDTSVISQLAAQKQSANARIANRLKPDLMTQPVKT